MLSCQHCPPTLVVCTVYVWRLLEVALTQGHAQTHTALQHQLRSKLQRVTLKGVMCSGQNFKGRPYVLKSPNNVVEVTPIWAQIPKSKLHYKLGPHGFKRLFTGHEGLKKNVGCIMGNVGSKLERSDYLGLSQPLLNVVTKKRFSPHKDTDNQNNLLHISPNGRVLLIFAAVSITVPTNLGKVNKWINKQKGS